MTSYLANFASHHTRDRHVGFLLAWNGIGKHNKMSCLTFYLVHTSITTYNRVTRILVHTHGGNLKSFCEIKSSCVFCCFSLYHVIQKRNQAAGQNCSRISAYRIMQTLYSLVSLLNIVSPMVGGGSLLHEIHQHQLS